jgi:hypothetical protein
MRMSLDTLRPEMVLAADIVDGMGRLLLPSGTALTDKHLRYCQMWGVLEAEVVGEETPEPPADAEVDPAHLAAAEAELLPLFRHCDLSHPPMETLFRYCAHRRALKRV